MKVTVCPGEGIGREITQVVLDLLRAAGAPLQFETVSSYERSEALASAARTGILLKGPTAFPIEEGTALGRSMFADKRVFRMLPGVPSPIGRRPLQLTMVRGRGAVPTSILSEEAPRDEMRRAALRLHRYVFEMALRKGFRQVTCAHGLAEPDQIFLDAFYDALEEFARIEANSVRIDHLARKLVTAPEQFEVIILPEPGSEILTDLAAGLVGGLAYSPRAQIGEQISIFEPAHGPVGHIVGQDSANPTAMLLSATMMLRHLQLVDHARVIEAALERTLYQMHRRPRGLDSWVPPFKTSVFRYVMLSELEHERRGTATPVPAEFDALQTARSSA